MHILLFRRPLINFRIHHLHLQMVLNILQIEQVGLLRNVFSRMRRIVVVPRDMRVLQVQVFLLWLLTVVIHLNLIKLLLIHVVVIFNQGLRLQLLNQLLFVATFFG